MSNDEKRDMYFACVRAIERVDQLLKRTGKAATEYGPTLHLERARYVELANALAADVEGLKAVS